MAFKKIKLNREGATRLGKKARDMWNENWDIIEGAIGTLDDYLSAWFSDVEKTLADYKTWMLAKFKDQDDRIDNVIINADGTNNAEMIDARQSSIDGTLHATVRARLQYDFDLVQQGIGNMEDLFEDQNFIRLPISKVFAIEHNQYGYPSVRVMSGKYGVGTVPLGTEPQSFGGASSNSVNCDVEYQDMNSLSVTVPLAYAMTNPTIERISENEYILVEGINTLIITIGNKAEANVETFVTKTMMSDFNGKVEASIIENSHTFKRSSSPTLQLPSGTWVENTQANYDSIMGLDGVVARYAYGTSTANAAMLFSWDVLWILEKNFPSIFKNTITDAEKVEFVKRIITGKRSSVWGLGSGPSGNLLQAKELLANGTWGSLASTNTTNQIREISTTFLDVNRITSDGKSYMLVNAEASDGTTASAVSIDYASITLTARVPFAKK